MKHNLKSVLAAAVAAIGLTAMADASVAIGTVSSHDPWDGQFDVSYTLSGVEAATDYKVAFDVTAGGKTAGVTNAAARLSDGTYRITLDTIGLFGSVKTDAKAKVRVSLIAVKSGTFVNDATGDAIGVLGDVMVIDISEGPTAMGYPVTYIADVDVGTLNCDVYKTKKIALLKIAAGTAYPAKPDAGAIEPIDAANVITPAKDYYIGVFPITEAQYALVMEGEAVSISNAPKTSVSWNALRGSVETATAITSSSAEGFFQKLCAKCRDPRGTVPGFDLPTDVQWEIAARAGSLAVFGSYLKEGAVLEGSSATASEFAVFGASKAQEVGTKLPNAWGLYDTAGNAWEWCRDDYAASGSWTSAETPKANDSGYKVIRGGCYEGTASEARLTNRNNKSPGNWYADSKTGFRLSKVCE